MTYQVEAFDLDYKGQGITKINDKITFVKKPVLKVKLL